jgi:hypothetical protein
MEPIEGSETSAFTPQTPGKYPKENTLQEAYTLLPVYTRDARFIPHSFNDLSFQAFTGGVTQVMIT